MTTLQQNPGTSDIDKRLKKFVKYFVFEVETILHTYNLILEGKADDDTIKKLSTICPETTGELVGSSAGRYIGSVICASEIGSEVGKVGGKKLGSFISGKRYLERTKTVKSLIGSFLQDESKFRQDLVNTAVDIFQSYERQFIHVSTDLGHEKAMQLLAKDAAKRTLNYYKNNKFTPDTLVDSIVLGKSAKVWGLPLEGRGFSVKSNFTKSNQAWKTESLYNKVGILRENHSTKTIELYVKINGKEKPDKYGFRRLFSDEKWDDIKGKYEPYNPKKSKKYKDYKYILNAESVEKEKKNILETINKKDTNLFENRIKDMMKEATSNILEQLNYLKKKGKNNGDCYRILKVVEEWLQKFSNSVDVCNEIKSTVQKMDNKLDTQHSVTMRKLSRIEEAIDDTIKKSKKPLWFEVIDATPLFTGRSDDMKELHNLIQRSSGTVTILSRMTCVYGQAGIGKTELARKYAEEHSDDYNNNVVWLNAEDTESLAKSFKRLAADEMNISTTNVDGDDKDIQAIVKDVYTFICEEKCLFIFDNVKTSQDIYDFLPRSLPPKHYWPYILVTSRNSNWEKGIEIKNLNELKLDEAVTLIRKGLSIQDGDQDVEIQKLLQKLQRSPGTLRLAITYIADQQRIQDYKIKDYLRRYKNMKHSAV